jgi:hypothetical protein
MVISIPQSKVLSGAQAVYKGSQVILSRGFPEQCENWKVEILPAVEYSKCGGTY